MMAPRAKHVRATHLYGHRYCTQAGRALSDGARSGTTGAGERSRGVAPRCLPRGQLGSVGLFCRNRYIPGTPLHALTPNRHMPSRRPRQRAQKGSPPEDCAAALQAVRALIATMGRSARTVERRTGLTNAQLFLLRQLALEGPLSVNELATRVVTKQSTVSLLAKRLYAAGLLRRERSATDARSVVLSISQAGRRLLRQAPAAPLTSLLTALCALDPRHRRALEQGLAALLQELGVRPDVAPPMFESGPRR